MSHRIGNLIRNLSADRLVLFVWERLSFFRLIVSIGITLIVYWLGRKGTIIVHFARRQIWILWGTTVGSVSWWMFKLRWGLWNGWRRIIWKVILGRFVQGARDEDEFKGNFLFYSLLLLILRYKSGKTFLIKNIFQKLNRICNSLCSLFDNILNIQNSMPERICQYNNRPLHPLIHSILLSFVSYFYKNQHFSTNKMKDFGLNEF